ncbi:tetratricopeptide repeat protein [Spirulina sp. 06S082]|uniref:tetratricopeptide repeat protein n=1 Tax=Spirulina sp. 06S082 TaxID=3110248 RepID=UPI002B218831|nr:tetratricopeptide repeat protein [Spirulina sp. 06S082]MEA5471008.1 tetratricopeptide repeat protein [Spirulina sp. 06S082]
MKRTASNNRFILIFTILLIILLVGGSLLPLVGNVFQGDRTARRTTATPTPQLSPVQQENLEDKARGYELVLQREPENATALQGLIEVRLEQGKLDLALPALERLAESHPQQPDYTILLAQAKEYLGDAEGAFQAYDRILGFNPGYIKALQGMVALQLQKNRPERAIGLLQTTLQTAAQANAVTPDSIDVASVQMLLGRVYEHQERYTEAIAVYDKIIETNDGDFRPVWAKAEIFKQQGEIDKAKPLYTRAVTLAPPKYKDQIKQLSEQIDEE